MSWFGTPLLNRYCEIVVVGVGELDVPVEHTLIADLHVVRAGDIRRRGCHRFGDM